MIKMTIRWIIQKAKRLPGIRTEHYHFDRNHQYLEIALQYYIVGRRAAFAQSMPVMGNLFHHAIEMFLKYFLLRSISVEKFRQKYRHDLWKLWRTAKEELKDSSLGRFDGFVKELNKFDDIRYPDSDEGYTCVFSIDKAARQQPGSKPVSNTSAPRFILCLEDVDEFVTVLLKGRVTTQAMDLVLNYGDNRALYMKENKHPHV